MLSCEPLRYIYETFKTNFKYYYIFQDGGISSWRPFPFKMVAYLFQDVGLSLPWWRPSFWASKLIHIMSHIDIVFMTGKGKTWLSWDKWNSAITDELYETFRIKSKNLIVMAAFFFKDGGLLLSRWRRFSSKMVAFFLS